MADYPSSLPVYATNKFTDNVTEVNAANSNYWWAELAAICTELGINPAGSASDLVTRLAISLELTGKLRLFQIVTSGTRPASPPEGMLIYETDTNKYYGCTVGGATPTWIEIPFVSALHTHYYEKHTVTAGEEASGIIDLIVHTYTTGNNSLQVELKRSGEPRLGLSITEDYAETSDSRITVVPGIIVENDILIFQWWK